MNRNLTTLILTFFNIEQHREIEFPSTLKKLYVNFNNSQWMINKLLYTKIEELECLDEYSKEDLLLYNQLPYLQILNISTTYGNQDEDNQC